MEPNKSGFYLLAINCSEEIRCVIISTAFDRDVILKQPYTFAFNIIEDHDRVSLDFKTFQDFKTSRLEINKNSAAGSSVRIDGKNKSDLLAC